MVIVLKGCKTTGPSFQKVLESFQILMNGMGSEGSIKNSMYIFLYKHQLIWYKVTEATGAQKYYI